jgi:hypothetical protein
MELSYEIDIMNLNKVIAGHIGTKNEKPSSETLNRAEVKTEDALTHSHFYQFDVDRAKPRFL